MADQYNLSSVIAAEAEIRSYVFKIRGYSRLKELVKNEDHETFPRCSFGGYCWVLWYFPNGGFAAHAGNIFLLLIRGYSDAEDVKTKVIINILDEDGVPASPRLGEATDTVFPGKHHRGFGLNVSHESLEESGYIIDDCLSIKCDLAVIKNISNEEKVGDQFVVVPPSDLHLHFSNLLYSMDGADVAFHVGGKKFLAHRFVLAARSSVFKAAELLGAMRENTDGPIQIHDMEADVFRCLLHFIYTDSLPALEMASDQGEARRDVVMAGHLLVAADRYNVERLKQMCEHKLCSHIDANMVANSLALADQHHCNRLKEACMQFLSSPSNLDAMMASDGYEQLKISCPSALKDLLARLLPVEMKAAKDILMAL